MYDLDEQQQLEIIKAWLTRHGKKLTIGIVAASIAAASFMGYRHYQHGQAEKASALYDTLVKMGGDADLKKVRLAASNIVESFPDTPYAARAAMIIAGRDFEAGEANDAKLQLQWVLDHSKEPELRDIARLRLAGILFDDKKYLDAIAMLDGQHGEAFDGLYSDLKGDIFTAQGNKEQARSAYLVALNKIDKASPYRDIVSIKLDSAGGEK